jgi:hypothetical protein
MADTALILAKNLSHTFYQKLYNHDRPDEWFVSVTKAFLKALQQERLAQASLVRIYATVRHFARWLHRKSRPSSCWAQLPQSVSAALIAPGRPRRLAAQAG